MKNPKKLFLRVLPSCVIALLCAKSLLAQSDTDAYVELDVSHVSEIAEFAAVVRSGKAAVLSSQIDGVISEIAFSEGEWFQEGDKLLSIDCAMPIAEQRKARAHLKYVKQEHSANLQLAKLDSISDVVLAGSAVEVEKASVEVGISEHKVKQCSLYAPFSGNVVRMLVQQYENVPEKTQLLEIVNNHDLRIEFLLPSEHLTRLERRHKFKLYVVETDQTYPAEVLRVIPQVDSVNQTVKVVARLTRSTETLWSGMSGFAQFSAFLDR